MRITASFRLLLLPACALLLLAPSAAAQLPPERQLARDILKGLVEINTTDSTGDNTRAANALAERLKAAGFPAADVLVLAPAPRKGNLIVRLRGTGAAKPLLFLAHLDVVEARREDWSFDPFRLTERDGYFYGRGTSDIKGDAALYAATFIRLKQEGFRPARDLILALTSDEETGTHNGVEWLLATHRNLIDAEYCINADGGGGELKGGRRFLLAVQAAEKTYLDLRLETKNKGGHSSLPQKDNAIYELAGALLRISRRQFPVNLNEVTRAFFERMAAIETGPAAQDMKAVAQQPPDAAAAARLSESPYYNALLRTTCVATMLEGGHAPNALPQDARANVNCRLLPGEDPEAVRQTLLSAVADPKVTLVPLAKPVASPFSPVAPGVFLRIERAAAASWPGTPVVPVMDTGASDGKWLRLGGMPVYGVSAIFTNVDDVRAHGRDERIGVQQFYEGLDFDYRLIKALASP